MRRFEQFPKRSINPESIIIGYAFGKLIDYLIKNVHVSKGNLLKVHKGIRFVTKDWISVLERDGTLRIYCPKCETEMDSLSMEKSCSKCGWKSSADKGFEYYTFEVPFINTRLRIRNPFHKYIGLKTANMSEFLGASSVQVTRWESSSLKWEFP